MSTPGDIARADALARIAERKRVQDELAIAEELKAAEAARGKPQQHLGSPWEATVQATKGALLGVAEWPAAAADFSESLGVPRNAIVNAIPRAISDYSKAGIKAAFPEAETTSGQLAEGIGRFVSTFVPVGRAIKLASAAGWMARGAVAGVVADYAAFEPAEQNLSAMLVENEWMVNPVTEYLATDPTDADADNRLRNALEGGLVGAVADGTITALTQGLKALRGVRWTKDAREAYDEGVKSADEITVPEAPTLKEGDVAPPAAAADEIPPTVVPSEPITANWSAVDPLSTNGTDLRYVTKHVSAGNVVHAVNPAGSNGSIPDISIGTYEVDGQALELFASGFKSNKTIYAARRVDADYHSHEIVGTVKVADDGSIEHVVVSPELRRKGLATRLLDEVEKRSGANTLSAADRSPDGAALLEARRQSRLPTPQQGNPTRLTVGDIMKGATPEQAASAAGPMAGNAAQTATALRATGEEGLQQPFNASKIDWNSFGDKADDIFNTIELIARSYGPQLDAAKGGVVPVEVTARKADALAGRLAKLTGGHAEGVRAVFNDIRGRDGGIAVRVEAAEDLMLQGAARVNQLANEALALRGTAGYDAARAKVLLAVEQQAAVMAHLRGAKSEVARAMRQMQELKKAAAVDLDLLAGIDEGLLKILGQERRLTDLNKAVRRASGAGFWDYMNELRINGLLSNPVTHVVNFTSNVVKVGMSIPERAVAAGIGKLRSLRRPDVERVRIQEATAGVYGLLEGAVDAIKLPWATLGKAAREAFRWDMTAARQTLVDDEQNFGNVYRSLARGHGIVDATTKLELREPAFRWDTSNTDGALKRGLQALNLMGSAIRAPGAALQASDEFFKSMAYRQELRALAMRTALTEADALPRAGREAFITKRVAEILKDPPEHLQMGSIEWARRQTFTNKLGQFGQWVQQGAGRWPAARLIVPFIRTPSNILKDFVNHTPAPLLQLVRSSYRKQLAAGGPEADLAIARMFLGTSAMAAVWQLAEAGKIRGGGPAGYNSDELGGGLEYSMQIGDTWVTFDRLEPMGMLFGMVADIHYMVDRRYAIDGDNTDLMEAVQYAAIAAAKNAASKTWLTGISDTVQAAADPDRYAEGYMRRMAVSFTPFSSGLRWATSVQDPFAREAFDYLDAMRAITPGKSDDLAVKRDWLGRPVEHGRSWISPVRINHESTDPVDRELARLDFEFDMPAKSLDGERLTEAQYSRLLELRGTIGGEGFTLYDELARTISSPEYAEMTDSPDASITRGSKAATIKMIVGRYHQAATMQLREEDPALLKQFENNIFHRFGQTPPQ